MFLTEEQFEDFQPLNDRVLIRRIGEKSFSRIIVPDIAYKPSWRGTILAVGPGKLSPKGVRIPLDVKVGDEVAFHGKWNDLDNAPPDIVLLQEGDIVGVYSTEE